MTARAGASFLLEIGCEEIPAAMIPDALDTLSAHILDLLGGPEGLGGTAASPPPFGGPRRIVAFIEGIREREEDRTEEVTGPPVKAAYGTDGRPTPAAVGFARAQGVRVEDLRKVHGDRGEVVAARRHVAGRTAREVLAAGLPSLLSALRFPKMMRWGDQGHVFVRPVHWIAALLDRDVVDFEFVGVRAGRLTQGHRFLAPGPHRIPEAQSYESILREAGRVTAAHAARTEAIRRGLSRAAEARGWKVREDEALLQEVTFLNEQPEVVAGEFPARFLSIPQEVLVTAMRHHQKYFTVRTGSGALAPGFLAVIDRDGDPDGVIVRGNEWVLRARLEDAGFFYAEDRKRSLADRRTALARVTFLERLGTVADRVVRLEGLASWIGARAGLDPKAREDLACAAGLCKSDLTTGMVGEFPELQGRIGGIYAREEGHSEGTAQAIAEQYLPASGDDPLPATPPGALLAIADKVDLLAGCFGIGLIPKGSADPYGLRRAAQGCLRILLAADLIAEAIPLGGLLEESWRRYADQGILEGEPGPVVAACLEFFEQRLRHLMEAGGVTFDTARAVTAAGFDDVRSAWLRAESLSAIRGKDGGGRADFEALAVSAKRCRNILAQARGKGHDPATRVDPALFVEADEKALDAAVRRAGDEVAARGRQGQWEAVWSAIASLRPDVDRFFDRVMVMAEDGRVRANRLALLEALSALLSGAADFSEIVVEGETTGGSK